MIGVGKSCYATTNEQEKGYPHHGYHIIVIVGVLVTVKHTKSLKVVSRQLISSMCTYVGSPIFFKIMSYSYSSTVLLRGTLESRKIREDSQLINSYSTALYNYSSCCTNFLSKVQYVCTIITVPA